MTTTLPVLTGLLVGLPVAAPVGPMGILCIQRTLAGGMRIGVSTGLGAATMNVAYAGLVVAFFGEAADWVGHRAHLIAACSGLFLLWSAARLFWRRAAGPGGGGIERTPAGAYASAAMLNATNPMSLVLIFALLSPVIGAAPASTLRSASLLGGLFAGAMTWWVCLSFVTATLRTRLTPAVLVHVNRVASAILAGYGLIALAHAMAR